MSDVFDLIDAPTAAVEGGYVNNGDDAGGETNHGITVATARAAGFTGAMRDMTREQAKAIRRAEFFVKPGFDRVAALSQKIGAEVYDTGINMGVQVAGEFLQRLLNVLNRKGADYPDLKVDGQIGDKTIDALAAFLRLRGQAGEAVLLKGLNCLQGYRYVELAERREANETFEFGWLQNRVWFAL